MASATCCGQNLVRRCLPRSWRAPIATRNSPVYTPNTSTAAASMHLTQPQRLSGPGSCGQTSTLTGSSRDRGAALLSPCGAPSGALSRRGPRTRRPDDRPVLTVTKEVAAAPKAVEQGSSGEVVVSGKVAACPGG